MTKTPLKRPSQGAGIDTFRFRHCLLFRLLFAKSANCLFQFPYMLFSYTTIRTLDVESYILVFATKDFFRSHRIDKATEI